MKNLIAITACSIALYACNTPATPSIAPPPPAEQVENAAVKTMNNMKAAYKGERTATAKYASFKKKNRAGRIPSCSDIVQCRIGRREHSCHES